MDRSYTRRALFKCWHSLSRCKKYFVYLQKQSTERHLTNNVRKLIELESIHTVLTEISVSKL